MARERSATKCVFATMAEAEANYDKDGNHRIYSVKDPTGNECFVIALNTDYAMGRAAFEAGWTFQIAMRKERDPVAGAEKRLAKKFDSDPEFLEKFLKKYGAKSPMPNDSTAPPAENPPQERPPQVETKQPEPVKQVKKRVA